MLIQVKVYLLHADKVLAVVFDSGQSLVTCMNILLSILSIVALTLVLGVFLILLPAAIISNSRAGRKYRTALAKKIHALRLGKMLTALGIDTEEYLSTERVVDIYQHIKRCGECANLDLCDEGLAGGIIEAGSIDFCNNKQALLEIVDKK